MNRAPLPPGLVTVHDLIPVRPLVSVFRGKPFIRERRPNYPLTPYTDAAALWHAVKRGEFPAPVRGPWGIAWRRETVNAWRTRRGIT